ncbi:restriction endonuclease subunit S [Brachyspira alvinipulli]|uniref:restriction endonuclease subunit S n=1 Tax=Brachyspira alvinipulli TaxID=84379 RepID=UPI00047FF036|nr:restriction endonuclease subunit S [Brachyspira alvinipulli]
MKKVKDDWQEVRLGDISYINSDILKKSDDYDYINYLDTGNITKGIIDNIQKIDISNIPSRAKRKVDIGDIIYSTVRPIQRHYGIIKKYIDNIIVSTGFITIKVKKDVADNYFIYYNITQDDIINYLQMIAEQSVSTYPSIKPSDLSDIKIKLPPLEEQKKIASILSSLDDKIEINNHMNKILEETAQTIFKEWFINFNFPNAKGKPYKDSGGKMIKSELGEIPEGWQIGIIKDISKEVICGKTPPTKDEKNYGNYMPFITIPDMHNNTYIIKTERYLSDKGVNTQFTKIIPENSICVSCIATVGLVSLTSEKSQTNQQINSIIPKDNISSYWVYFYMKNISNIIINYASGGTTTLNLNKSLFEKINIIIPKISLLIKFNNSVKSIFDTIKLNQIENQKLASIRDSILPKLMSGEIRIK